MLSRFFQDIVNNDWDSYVKPTLEKVVAKKIVSKVQAYKDEYRKNGTIDNPRG